MEAWAAALLAVPRCVPTWADVGDPMTALTSHHPTAVGFLTMAMGVSNNLVDDFFLVLVGLLGIMISAN